MKGLALTYHLAEAAVYLTPLHVTDHLGSVRTVVGGKDGAVYAADDYCPYGTVSSILAAGSAPEPPGGVTLRDGFTGQESQAPDFGIPYVDFGARLYSPALRRWLTPDPLSEKYYGVSPYAYCLGDPISLFDPNGTDVWTVDALGNVVWKEQSDTHCLYYVDNDGNLSEDYVIVSDRSILDDLTKTEIKTDGGAEVSSHSSKTGINDMFKVFKFASDNTKVEWAIHRNGDTYTIGTGHKTNNAASWEDYVDAMPNATVHSHPGINAIVSEETYSMGYGATVRKNDQNNFKLDVKKYGIAARKNYVYFPNSGRLYKVGYNNAIFIKNVVSYKGFYFGVMCVR